MSSGTMSLKHYLFALIALFVILLAGIQMGFVHLIQQKIDEEVAVKSRTLSEKAVGMLVENVHFSARKIEPVSRPAPAISIRIEDTPGKSVDIGNGYEFITGEQTQTVTIEPLEVHRAPDIELFSVLQEQLDNVRIAQVKDGYQFNVSYDAPDRAHQKIVQFAQQDSVISTYMNWLIIGIAGIGAIGLLLAYVIARHISKPLANLSSGFSQLESGGLGTQVPPQGIQEVRQTLEKFNHMSERLSELNQVEKRYQQQQQLAELGEVSRGLAHTLRNPINTIGLAIEQMAQPDMEDQQRATLALQVRQKIQHLDGTLKALLSLTASGVKRDLSVNISDVIQDIIMELSMSGKQLIHFDPKQPLVLNGAPSEFRSVIHTLIANAVEATQENASVAVFARQEKDGIRIHVIDEGKGIDPSIREQLFSPHISTKPEGAGMGLYIAQRICQSHYHGNITLSDNTPTGCIATVTFYSAQEEDNA